MLTPNHIVGGKKLAIYIIFWMLLLILTNLVYFFIAGKVYWKIKIVGLEAIITFAIAYYLLYKDIKEIERVHEKILVYLKRSSQNPNELILTNNELILTNKILCLTIVLFPLITMFISLDFLWSSFHDMIKISLISKSIISIIIALMCVTILGKMALEYAHNKSTETFYKLSETIFKDPNFIRPYEE